MLTKVKLPVGDEIEDLGRALDPFRHLEKWHKVLFEYAADALYLSDLKGTFINGNRAAEALTGYKREELIGKSFLKLPLLPGDQIPKAIALLARNALGKATGPDELALVRRDRARIAVEITTYPFKINGTTLILGVVRGVSEHKNAERSLWESENILRRITESAYDAIIMSDDKGLISFWNPAAERTFGFAKEDVIGLGLSETIIPEGYAKDFKISLRSFAKHGSGGLIGKTIEVVARNKGGAEFPVELSISPIEIDGAWHAIGVVRDISERKRTEEKLKQSERLLRSILDNAPFGAHIYELGPSGRLVFVGANRSADRILGVDNSQFIGKTIEEAFPALAASEIPEAYRRVAKSGELFETEQYAYDNQGISGVFEIHAFQVGPSRMAAFFRDITERWRAEEALRKSEERLREAQTLGKIGSWEFDLASNKIDWSDETYALYERDKALGPPSDEVDAGYYSPDQIEILREYVRLAREKGQEFTFDLNAQLPSGKSVFFNASMRPHKDGAGRVTKLFGTVQDISERKRTEDALRTSEAQLSNALRIAQAGHWEYDVASDTFTFNDNFYRIFRTTAEEVGGYKLSSSEYAHRFCHPDDMHMVREETEAAIKTDDPYYGRELEHRILFPNGEVGNIAVRFFIVKDSEGRTVKTYGVNQDITERKRAEEALRNSEAQLRRALREAINALSSAIEMRDPYTAGHQERVAKLAVAIARKIGLSDESLETLEVAGIVHDIGKLSIPAEILSKPTTLTEIEVNLVKTHAQIGCMILSEIDFPWPIARIVNQHHERLDGSGYPNGLTGKDLLMESKILAVADTVEAMASHRPYRPALGIGKALEQITRYKDILYDARVVDACLMIFQKNEFQL